MKRIVFVSVLGCVLLGQYFVAREEMVRDENSLKVPVFIPVKHAIPNIPYVNPVADATNERVKEALLPLIDSESVEMAAALLKDLPVKRAKEIVAMVFDDKAFRINLLEKRLFFAAVAGHYKDNPEQQADFFELMLKYPVLYEGEPLTYTLIAHNYEFAVPWVIRTLDVWQKNKKISLPKGIEDIVERGYTEVLKRNDAQALIHMTEKGVMLDQHMASKLLWRAASLPGSTPVFVKLFKEKGADLNFNKDGYSPIMKAVLSNNLSFVKALVEAGVPVDTLYKDEAGTALQLAVEKGFVDVELYLRSKGARL